MTLRVLMPDSVAVPAILRILRRAEEQDPFWTEMEMHFSAGAFITCHAIAFLAAWGARQLQRGCRFTLTGDERVCRYLARMNLFRELQADAQSFRRFSEIGRFVPLIGIDSNDSAKAACDAICDLALHQFENARAFVPGLEWATNEIIDNIVTHADAPCPGMVCAQYYPRQQRFDVGIYDVGRGIRATLSESQNLSSDEDALEAALTRGVTRDRNIGAGNGLAGADTITRANGGVFVLWSGEAAYKLQQYSQQPRLVSIPYTQGTGVAMSLRSDVPVDLRRTWIASGDWSYIAAEAQRLSEAGGIRVRDECLHTGGRAPASALRRKITSLIPELEEPLALDFAGVASASSSFMDELLGRIVHEHGVDVLRSRLRIINISESVRRIANAVIAERVK